MPQSAPIAYYNTGETSGMNSGTTATMTSGGQSPTAAAMQVAGGNANISVAVLVAGSLALLLVFHLLGFRFGFDVSVGRK